MIVCLGVPYTMSKEGTNGLVMSKETCFLMVKFLRSNRKSKWRVTSDTTGRNPRGFLRLVCARRSHQHWFIWISSDDVKLGRASILTFPSDNWQLCSSGSFRNLPKIPQLVNVLCRRQNTCSFTTSWYFYAHVVTRDDRTIWHRLRHHVEAFLTCVKGSPRESWMDYQKGLWAPEIRCNTAYICAVV